MSVGGTRPASAGHTARLAAEFWQAAGGGAAFPRDPEPLIGLAVPVSVFDIPALSCGVVSTWAASLGLIAVKPEPDRPLRGCLLAYAGDAFLLLDPDDPADERRMTIAHELGHYFVEVWEPRRRITAALGRDALAVLDGRRPATFDERLGAALAGQPLTPHVHLMARQEDGSIGCARVAAAEWAADTFALELLAPRASLRRDVLALTGRPFQQRWAVVTDLLIHRHGLPAITAGGYARELVQELTGGESVREWLGLADGD